MQRKMDASIFYLFSGYFFTPDSQKKKIKVKDVNKGQIHYSESEKLSQKGITTSRKNKSCKNSKYYMKIKNEKIRNTKFVENLQNAKIMAKLMKTVILKDQQMKDRQEANSDTENYEKWSAQDELWDIIFHKIENLIKKPRVESTQQLSTSLAMSKLHDILKRARISQKGSS